MSSTRQKRRETDQVDTRPSSGIRHDNATARSQQDFHEEAQHVVAYEACYEAIKHEFKYKMDHPSRGYAIIINNRKFDKPCHTYREGSDIDRDSLVQVCKYLGFNEDHIIVRDDQTVQEMKNLVKDYTELSKDVDCFMMFILTHGGSAGKIEGRDTAVAVSDLLRPLKDDRNPLIGKPKLIFVQACRGIKKDRGVILTDENQDQNFRGPRISKISRESDFLIGYSTVEGYYSFRNIRKGSWFVQAIREVFTHEDSRHLGIADLMCRVARAVSYQQKSDCVVEGKKETGLKQSPLYTSTLTKELYFYGQS